MRRQNNIRPAKHKHAGKEKVKASTREPTIAEKITNRFHISEDVTLGAPIIIGYGTHRFCLENYRNIIEYTDEKIRIQTKVGKIHVLGKNLVIAYYRDDAMCIMGDIASIEYK